MTLSSTYIPIIQKISLHAINIKICIRGAPNIPNMQKMSIEIVISHTRCLLEPIKRLEQVAYLKYFAW